MSSPYSVKNIRFKRIDIIQPVAEQVKRAFKVIPAVHLMCRKPLLVSAESLLTDEIAQVSLRHDESSVLLLGEILDELMEHFNQGDAPGFIRGLGR